MQTMQKQIPEAMSFYHSDGLPSAWKWATRFAGNGGRLATMPDIVAARLGADPNKEANSSWDTYFTTLTEEYLGLSRQGNKILIVAHGNGPMSTLDGAIKAYSWQFKDKERRREGGRITQQEFWDLEDGKYGEVSIVDFESYCKRYEHPFMEVLRASQAVVDPVVNARFGPQAQKYIEAHVSHARVWYRTKAGIDSQEMYQLPLSDDGGWLHPVTRWNIENGAQNSDPYVLRSLAIPYPYWSIDEGFAMSHLISVGRLVELSGSSLTHDIDIHGWNNGTRFVGIRAGCSLRQDIRCGPGVTDLLKKHWRDLLVSVKELTVVPFCALVRVGDQWFTQYPKVGSRMDTGEPEHVVTSMKKVGDPVLFRTTIGGYHGFFKYDIKDVKAIAPRTANAYFFVSDVKNEWHGGNPTHQVCEVQFYRIEVDSSKRLIRSDQLSHDFDTLMELLAKE